MQDSLNASLVPVWGISLDTAYRRCLGHISVDRSGPSTVYTTQLDDRERLFHTEVAAAWWLAEAGPVAWDLVLIGRCFDPWAIARQSTSEGVREERLQPGDVGTFASSA